MSVVVVGVRFKKAGKVYYFEPGEEELAIGDGVIVETARGLEFGWVSLGPKEVGDEEVVPPLKKVIRKASTGDSEQLAENDRKKSRAMEICVQKVADHRLPMKVVDVEYTFDNNKIVFYFSAEGRIDFRELVKDLASVFRTRIELRQIGVRDEAKMLGGLGPCGRPLCCRTFLGDFAPVSIKMAKEQNLSLNPTKISGLCGRLMCCLKYESDAYRDARSRLPRVGATVALNGASGTVIEVNPLVGKLLVYFGDEGKKEVTAAELGIPDFPTSACENCPASERAGTEKRASASFATSSYGGWSSTSIDDDELDEGGTEPVGEPFAAADGGVDAAQGADAAQPARQARHNAKRGQQPAAVGNGRRQDGERSRQEPRRRRAGGQQRQAEQPSPQQGQPSLQQGQSLPRAPKQAVPSGRETDARREADQRRGTDQHRGQRRAQRQGPAQGQAQGLQQSQQAQQSQHGQPQLRRQPPGAAGGEHRQRPLRAKRRPAETGNQAAEHVGRGAEPAKTMNAALPSSANAAGVRGNSPRSGRQAAQS